MIRVQIKKEDGNIYQIAVTGHASSFYFKGNRLEKFIYFLVSAFFKKRISLLCCAVSVLFKTLELALEKECILLNSLEMDGMLKLYVKKNDKSNYVCNLFLVGVYELRSQYNNELVIEEVNND